MKSNSICWESYYCRIEQLDQESWRSIYKISYFLRGKSKRCLGYGLVSGNGYRGWTVHVVTKKFNGSEFETTVKEDGPWFKTIELAAVELGKLALCKDVTKPRPILTMYTKYKIGHDIEPPMKLNDTSI